MRVGLNPTLEISTHPLVSFVMPNFSTKISWGKLGPFQGATEHTVTSPTVLLRLLSGAGSGGILPEETQVPFIVSLSNTLYLSTPLTKGHLITSKVALHLAEQFGDSTLPTIDLPVVMPRTAAYHDHVTMVLGLDLDGCIGAGFHYEVDVDLWLMPNRRATFALEHSSLVAWRPSHWFALQLGYKLSWAQYPYGMDWHVLPLLDVVFAVEEES